MRAPVPFAADGCGMRITSPLARLVSLRRGAARVTVALVLGGATLPAAASADLRFGAYPWGAAGTTTKTSAPVPENADESMRAVQRLRGDREFVVHVYGDYDGVSNRSVDGLLSEATWWSENGLKVSAVLRYRPADASKAAGYANWVRTQVRRLAALPGTVSVTIGNEPNNLSPGAGDGSYAGVIEGISSGVVAARSELDATGRADVRVGFNWAAGSSPSTTEPMWSALRSAGGDAFTSAVGFVGVNVYPGTWSPPWASGVPTSEQISDTVRGTLASLRATHMPVAGVGAAEIIVSETGYPTSSSRTETTQDMVVRTILATVAETQALYGVTDLYAFALRDGNTGSGELENGYGFLRDDYSPKPAFETFRAAIATGAPAPTPDPDPTVEPKPEPDPEPTGKAQKPWKEPKPTRTR
jgi:hypothetical protein